MDWIKSIIIISIFLLFIALDSFNANVQSIQDNWSLYRCNPMMMPFASYFAPPGTEITAQDNFSYCIQSMMTTFAPSITQPFEYLQSMSVDMMGSISDSTSASTEQSAGIRFSVGSIFTSIYGVFINIIVQFNIIVIKLTDIQGKISAVMTTLLYILTTVEYTFESMWNGIPGKMIRTISGSSKSTNKKKSKK
jgi:hypothetical protein